MLFQGASTVTIVSFCEKSGMDIAPTLTLKIHRIECMRVYMYMMCPCTRDDMAKVLIRSSYTDIEG
jgi:hypothetical protein